jgi:uncharacterized repeat protein (TIGR03987 family)
LIFLFKITNEDIHVATNNFIHRTYIISACILFSGGLVRTFYSFWIGLTSDILGKWTMHRLANGPFDFIAPHTLTGQIALWVMLIHAIWATSVARKDSDELRTNFHRYSLIIWLIWLVPYFGGMYMGMTRHF